MPRLVDRMPFSSDPGELGYRGERVRVRADQIIVWVSLNLQEIKVQNPVVAPFPAILDTGLSHSFAISERHLIGWAGLRPENLATRAAISDRGQRISLRQANLWMHPNEAGSRERLADRSPHLLRARTGIAVYPGDDFPRLPLVGLRVICENGLILKVEGPARHATLRTPLKWWFFS